MLMIRGGNAFPEFRRDSLLASIRERDPDLHVDRLDAVYVYFLGVRGGPLVSDKMDRIASLLDASEVFDNDEGFLVTPRKGTISPWSSKATDIFHNCGLTDVRRVERGIHYRLFSGGRLLEIDRLQAVLDLLHDRMVEGVYRDVSDLFTRVEPPPCREVDLASGGEDALRMANRDMGLALSEEEIHYLCEAYRRARRNPTDVELVMFAQVNSEHCRHKIFNAEWIVDGEKKPRTLFEMIRNTHKQSPEGTLVAYRDNAGVIEGFESEWFEVGPMEDGRYGFTKAPVDIIMKVETHNHPTAIAPYPGAATGVGGEIRDESATGVGGKSKAGLSAFFVSNLRIPDFAMPWEKDYGEFPARLATPLEIMTEGPIGGARFGNEFGRPQLCGLFRTYEEMCGDRYRGYHKPIMVAGGVGNIKREHTAKKDLPRKALVIQIGGPAMRIGLGGGAASSMATGSNVAELDFDSVQRDNAEMQRRAQEVIEACIARGKDNPVLRIHDLGAGGLSNGCPELVSDVGATFRLRDVPNEDSSMSPMEIWCCEAQERYVLAIGPGRLDEFLSICRRERCPVAVIGEVTDDNRLVLEDAQFANRPIDIDIDVILGKPPRTILDVRSGKKDLVPLDIGAVSVKDAAERVLRLPAVANKTFLITITDRSVTGRVARDQMVGPYQVPLSDVAVTATSFNDCTGEAMAMGERTPSALISAPASGRMAISEALMNIAAANVGSLGNVKLSANWMCACGEDGEDSDLYKTVQAVGMDLCPELGISIPVGKDSLSMRTVWKTSQGRDMKMTAPLSLVISAFSPVQDVRKTVTPDVKPEDSRLLFVDLGEGRNRLGGSAFAQVYNQLGDTCPDLDDPVSLRAFFSAVQEMVEKGLLLAYHDRSDGGLFVTLVEMAIGGRSGLRVNLEADPDDLLPLLFAEELGAVFQISPANAQTVEAVLEKHGLTASSRWIGERTADRCIRIERNGGSVFDVSVAEANRAWSELTYRMQTLRDNPRCAAEEYEALSDEDDPGMQFVLTFDPEEKQLNISTTRPRVLILREQGINGQTEMAAAFDRAGFECVDAHMTDLMEGRRELGGFTGFVACGGFSYGDVLGAGSGWAKSILYHGKLREMFADLFANPNTFALGVCNGCQMMSQLKSIIPGAEHWPAFSHNLSEQFEARFVSVRMRKSPSVLLQGMEGSRLGIVVAHGEGRADFTRTGSIEELEGAGLVSMQYVDNRGNVAAKYPFNPNGSPDGIAGLTTPDGRVTIMMPHPERAFRAVQLSYRPKGVFEGEAGPWLRLFQNARRFVD